RHTRFSRDWSSDVCSSDLTAIPTIATHLEQPDDPYRTDALLVLAQLHHSPAIPQLVRLLHDLTYGQDAREALDQFAPGDVLPPRSEERRVGKECRTRSARD